MRDLAAQVKGQAAHHRDGHPAQCDGDKALLCKKGFPRAAADQQQEARRGQHDQDGQTVGAEHVILAVDEAPDQGGQHEQAFHQDDTADGAAYNFNIHTSRPGRCCGKYRSSGGMGFRGL